MTDYKAVVDAGVEWLDANRPNWREMIDRDTLWLASTARCVLGQTGGYNRALFAAVPDMGKSPDAWDTTWQERDDWATEHGFRVSDNPPSGNFDTDYADLTDEWLTRL